MNKVDYLIIGGGVAGTTAAETIRSKNPDASITILTEELERLYSRVLLPHYLRNENTLDSVYIRTPESYLQKNISLLTKTKVSKIDIQSKTVLTESGDEFAYEKLLLASGGKVNKLTIPGSDLPQVFYLRTMADAQKVKKAIGESKEAVVIGGGFIGIEFAQSFRKNNLNTTAIIREKYFWENVVGENCGKLLSKILETNGVRIVSETEVSGFTGESKLEAVTLKNEELIKADLVGIGVGIHLDLGYLADSGLKLNKGVITDQFLATSDKNIWAAGDLAEFYDPYSDSHHVLGNWANASSQGRVVGLNMVGEKTEFETTSMYSINIFDTNFSFLGTTTSTENIEIIERGGLEEGKIGQLFIKNDVLIGACLLNLPLDRNAVSKLIKSRTKLNQAKSNLSDTNYDLSQLI